MPMYIKSTSKMLLTRKNTTTFKQLTAALNQQNTSIFIDGKKMEDYAKQLSENPELTATEFEDVGTKYEDKNGHRAGYVSADGKSVYINSDDGKKVVSYHDTDGDGVADRQYYRREY